jgi:hypothetical protein
MMNLSKVNLIIKKIKVFLPSIDPLVLDVDDIVGRVLISFSSTIGNDLFDNVSWDFFVVFIVFTVILFEFSFLIIDCCGCFFFGLIIDGSTLTFLLLAEFVVGIGENGRFCGGE